MGEAIVTMYVEALVITIMVVVFIISVIKKKRWFRWEKAAPDMKRVIKKHEKKLNMGSKLIVGVTLGVVFIWQTMPAILDLPNVMNEKYLKTEGEVVGWDFSDEKKKESRSITIVDSKTNQEINIRVYSTGIHKGEYLKVIYLPNSRYGTVEARKE